MAENTQTISREQAILPPLVGRLPNMFAMDSTGLILQAIGTLSHRIDDRIAEVRAKADQQFGEVHKRFDTADKCFETIDQCFAGVQQRFDTIDEPFTHIDQRVAHIGECLDDIEDRLDEGVVGHKI